MVRSWCKKKYSNWKTIKIVIYNLVNCNEEWKIGKTRRFIGWIKYNEIVDKWDQRKCLIKLIKIYKSRRIQNKIKWYLIAFKLEFYAFYLELNEVKDDKKI